MFLYYVFNTMLIMLLIFHIYWWKLICAMILRQLKNRGKVGEDIRSGKQISWIQIECIIINLLFFCLGTTAVRICSTEFIHTILHWIVFHILLSGEHNLKMLLHCRMFCNSCIFIALCPEENITERYYWLVLDIIICVHGSIMLGVQSWIASCWIFLCYIPPSLSYAYHSSLNQHIGLVKSWYVNSYDYFCHRLGYICNLF